MVDVVDKATRSRMMSGIRGKDTKPEILVRKALFSRGYRYKLHDKSLPGNPDLVLPKYRAIILINGCFWHKHECHLFKWPSTRKKFWREKLHRNTELDLINCEKLFDLGWRVITVWECALKGKESLDFKDLIGTIDTWLKSDFLSLEIP